jgi:hypothetical protein
MTVGISKPWDVVVAGGGPAGIPAALAAARAGARTLLVERHGAVGGNATMGFPLHGFFNNREERIVDGIPWELVGRLKAQDAAAEVRNVGVGEPRGRGSLKFNARFVVSRPEAFKAVSLEMLREAGVELMLHTWVADVLLDGSRVAGLVVENKAGRTVIPAGLVVDCTGDGDVAARAGAPFERGRQGDGGLQPLTPLFTLSGVEMDRVEPASRIVWPYEVVGSGAWRAGCRGSTVRLEPWSHLLQAELPEFAPLLQQFNVWELADGVSYCGNMLHLPGLDASRGDHLSQAETAGRRMVWQLAAFLRRHVAGFENAHLITTAIQVGIRETRRILGEYVLAYDDVVDARRFADTIALCGYRVDIHGYDGGTIYNEPPRGTQVRDYGSYGMPYRCLVPRAVDGLLVAGRCVSATHEAQGSCRVIGSCMAMGQAAGLAAALSAWQGRTPRELSVPVLQNALRRQGARLGDDEGAQKTS